MAPNNAVQQSGQELTALPCPNWPRVGLHRPESELGLFVDGLPTHHHHQQHCPATDQVQGRFLGLKPPGRDSRCVKGQTPTGLTLFVVKLVVHHKSYTLFFTFEAAWDDVAVR